MQRPNSQMRDPEQSASLLHMGGGTGKHWPSTHERKPGHSASDWHPPEDWQVLLTHCMPGSGQPESSVHKSGGMQRLAVQLQAGGHCELDEQVGSTQLLRSQRWPTAQSSSAWHSAAGWQKKPLQTAPLGQSRSLTHSRASTQRSEMQLSSPGQSAEVVHSTLGWQTRETGSHSWPLGQSWSSRQPPGCMQKLFWQTSSCPQSASLWQLPVKTHCSLTQRSPLGHSALTVHSGGCGIHC